MRYRTKTDDAIDYGLIAAIIAIVVAHFLFYR